MEPLAVYQEKRFSGRRVFTLFSDKIHVRGKDFLEKDFDLTIELVTLSPLCQKLWIRDKMFWAGIILVGIPAIMAKILMSAFGIEWSNEAVGLMFALAISGVLLCLATVRKVEFCSFSNNHGIPTLAIAKSGKQKEDFGTFIERLVSAIKNVREGAEQIPETDSGAGEKP